MAEVELIMPKMGESIMEATILKWLKKEGDAVSVDEPVLEIATDKVDSEVPSPFAGTVKKILFDVNDVVPVGKVIAVLETPNGATAKPSPAVAAKPEETLRRTGNKTSCAAKNRSCSCFRQILFSIGFEYCSRRRHLDVRIGNDFRHRSGRSCYQKRYSAIRAATKIR